MEDHTATQDRPGLFSRFANIFARPDDAEEYSESTADRTSTGATGHRGGPYHYTVTIRRQITSFDDALAAANGLKGGEQQILNLSGTDAVTRQKIVDFMCGVNYAQEGTWEEVGEDVYLIVPATAFVEVAPPTPRMNALRN